MKDVTIKLAGPYPDSPIKHLCLVYYAESVYANDAIIYENMEGDSFHIINTPVEGANVTQAIARGIRRPVILATTNPDLLEFGISAIPESFIRELDEQEGVVTNVKWNEVTEQVLLEGKVYGEGPEPVKSYPHQGQPQVVKADVYSYSIVLTFLDKDSNEITVSIPLPTRSDRADVEDRLLTAGVFVQHQH